MKYIITFLLLGILIILSSSIVLGQSLFNPTSIWNFDETGFPLIAKDSKGLLNLTLNTAILRMQTGKLNNALRVNNSGSNVAINSTNVPNNLILDKNPFTIAFWINASNGDGGTGYILLGSQGNTATRWSIGTMSGNNNVSFNTNSVTTLTSPNTTLSGSYNRVVFVREGTGSNQFKVYLNNINVRNTTLSNNFSDNTDTFRINSANGGSTGFNLDDVRIYNNYAWTTSDVNTDWNSGNGMAINSLIVNLNTPADTSFQLNESILFNASANFASGTINGLRNATLYLYKGNTLFNQTTINMTGSINNSLFYVSGFTVDNYKWNVRFCANDSTDTYCFAGTNNFTFTSGKFTEEFENTLIEGQSTGVNLNITIDGIDQNILALLIWNNTQTIPTKNIINSTRIRFTSNFVVPVGIGNSTGVNISHHWRFYLSDNSLNDTTTSKEQTVYSLGFDNCTTFSSLLFNYTMYDEDTLDLVNGTIEVSLSATSLADTSQITNFSNAYNNTNNALICISSIASGFKIDSQARYTASNYVVEFQNIQNSTLSASNFPQHIRLFPLLSSRSQEFLVTFKDTNFAPVKDALITITRKYVGEGLFRTIEAPLTNADGQVLSHMVLGDVIYTIIVLKNGVLLGTFDNIVPFCNNVATGDCSINLNAFTTGTRPTNFNTFRNLSYNIIFNKTARTITSTFNTLDGSVATVNLTGTLFDNRGNTTACSTALTTSSGSIICTIPASIGNSTIRAILYKDGQYVTSGLFSLTDDTETGFGSTGLLMMVILYITVPLMMISSGAGIVIGAILGLIFAGLLNLYTGGGIIGIGSALIWFIIAGVIILWKINDRRGS